MIALALLAGGLLIAVNAVFVATEFALVASRTHLLEEAAEGGDRGAVLALRARSDLRRQLSGAQLGITVSSVLLGILAEPSIGGLVAPALDRLQMPSGVTETVGWLLALGTAAVLQMLLGELDPKNVAIAPPVSPGAGPQRGRGGPATGDLGARPPGRPRSAAVRLHPGRRDRACDRCP